MPHLRVVSIQVRLRHGAGYGMLCNHTICRCNMDAGASKALCQQHDGSRRCSGSFSQIISVAGVAETGKDRPTQSSTEQFCQRWSRRLRQWRCPFANQQQN